MFHWYDLEFKVVEHPEDFRAIQELRYRVYVDECGFEESRDHPEGLETDPFDDSSIHIAAMIGHRAVGTVRLVLNGPAGLPIFGYCPDVRTRFSDAGPRVAEISRFAVDRDFRRRSEDGLYGAEGVIRKSHPRASLPPAAIERRGLPVIFGLWRLLIQVTNTVDVRQWLMVTEPALGYLLRRYGMNFRALGPKFDFRGPLIPFGADFVTFEDHLAARNRELADFLFCRRRLAASEKGDRLVAA